MFSSTSPIKDTPQPSYTQGCGSGLDITKIWTLPSRIKQNLDPDPFVKKKPGPLQAPKNVIKKNFKKKSILELFKYKSDLILKPVSGSDQNIRIWIRNRASTGCLQVNSRLAYGYSSVALSQKQKSLFFCLLKQSKKRPRKEGLYLNTIKT